MPTLGDLVVNITANTKAFNGDVEKAEKSLVKLDKNVLKFGKNMTKFATLPILAAGAGLIKLTSNLGKNADKLLDLEQITGLSTTTLQEFQNVATVAGVSFDGLTGVIQKFSSRLPTIEAGTSETAKAFDSLGVALKDSNGEVRTSEDLFPELISALQDIENVTERNATAQQVFGRSLGDLAPVLGLTAEETKNARDQAHELGLVLEREAILKANEYRIQTELLTKQLKQQGVEIASSLIPVFQDLIPIISDTIGKISDGVDAFTELDDGTKKIILGVAGVTAGIGPALVAISKLSTALKILALPKGPIGLIIVAVGGLVTAIATLKALSDGKVEKTFGDLSKTTGVTSSNLKKIADISEGLIQRADSVAQGFELAQKNSGLTKKELLEVLKVSGSLTESQLKYIGTLTVTATTAEDLINLSKAQAEALKEVEAEAQGLSVTQLKAYADQNAAVQALINANKPRLEQIDEELAFINTLALADGELKEDQAEASRILQAEKQTILDEERTAREADYIAREKATSDHNDEVYQLEKETNKKILDDAKELTENRIALAEDLLNFASSIASAIVQISNNESNEEIRIKQEALNQEIEINNKALESAIAKNDQELADALQLSNDKLAIKLEELDVLTVAEQELLDFKKAISEEDLAQSILDDEIKIANLLATGDIEDAEEARRLQRDIDNDATLRILQDQAKIDEEQRIKDITTAKETAATDAETLRVNEAAAVQTLLDDAATEEKRIKKETALALWEIEKEQFNSAQDLAYGSIAIDTAVGIAKTFAQLGWPGGILGASIVAGEGIAQAAIVGSQKPPRKPQLETGAFIKGSQRGIDVTVGEGGNDEEIFGMGPRGVPRRSQLAKEVASMVNSGGSGQTNNYYSSMFAPLDEASMRKFTRMQRPYTIEEKQRIGG